MLFNCVEKHTPGLLIDRKRKIGLFSPVVCNAYLNDVTMRVKKLKIEAHNMIE